MPRMLSLVGAFLRQKSGNIPIMMALLMIPMTLMAGGSVDLVARERIRVALQDALDRGVLAAASLTQSEDPRALVTSYLKTVPQGLSATLTLTEERRTNFRKISASASIAYTTTFLKLAHVETLNVGASSAAQEARQNIELSLVLDISGSMYDNKGMVQLKPAAKSFLDVVLKNEVRAVTSVSIVPFAGTVNLGEKVFDHMAGPGYVRRHSQSSCFEMLDGDFSAGTPPFSSRDQVPHFTFYNYNVTGKKPWWCPTDDAAVTYPTNDLTYLKSRIDALQPFDGTGTAYGMKWGELLLNPSMRPTVKAIGDKNLGPVPAAFRDRPLDFNTDALKFIVLMTDGQIGFQPRPKSLTTNEVTNKNINGDHREVYTTAQSTTFYKRTCDYAKKQGIVVFTIAFAITSDSVAADIAKCATYPSYAYRVDGLNMASAFQSVATAMQKIRLVN